MLISTNLVRLLDWKVGGLRSASDIKLAANSQRALERLYKLWVADESG